MQISDNGLLLIENEEGFVSHVYNDGFGNLTVGFGTTNSVVSPLPEFVTRAQAEDLLIEALQRQVYPEIDATKCPLNQNQFDALCDLGYNCGGGVFTDAYSLGRALRARDYRAVESDFMLFVYANGRVVQDLVNRRRTEQILFEKPYKAPPPKDPHHYLRFADSEFPSPWGKIKERKIVTEYDGARLHPEKYASYLHEVLEPRLRWLANRLAHVVIYDRNRDWTSDWAWWRYPQLLNRSKGEQLVK